MGEDEQQFCLKWNNYSLNMSSVFKEMLESESLCDVTLAVQDQTIKAHRLVLTACSGFFRKAFQDTQPWQQPIVFLKDMKYDDLKGIIEFIYNGEVSVDQGALTSFLLAAESLKIKGLTEDNQRQHNGIEDFTKIKTNRITNNGASLERIGCGVGGAAVEATPQSPEQKPELDDCNNVEESNIEDDMEEDEITEEELKNSNYITQQALDKYETDEHFLNNAGGGIQLDPNIMIPPGMSPAEMGMKKTCPYCFQKLSWHALSRHIRDMHKAKTDLVNCKYCFKTFRNKNSLGCHIWRFHKRVRENRVESPSALQQQQQQQPTATIS